MSRSEKAKKADKEIRASKGGKGEINPKKAKKEEATPSPIKLIDLSPEAVAKLPKPREGFELHLGELLQIYTDHAQEMSIGNIRAEDLLTHMKTAETLKPLIESARKHLEMLEETSQWHTAQVWSAMLEIYAKAQVVGRSNPDVKNAIEPFVQFMKVGKRKKKS
jgi:hypothetical protein